MQGSRGASGPTLRYSRAVITADDGASDRPDGLEASPDVGRVIVSEADLQARIAELGAADHR